MSQRKQGFPLSKLFNKALWKLWDNLTPSERQEYEVYYEERDNSIVNKLIKKNAKRNS